MMIHSTAQIHPTAIVEEGAQIGENVVIGPFCIIGAEVKIGKGTVLNSHVVVKGITEIGEDNHIFQFSSIGEINQDLKYQGEPTKTIIGDRNRIREHVTIHRGTIQGGGVTRIGDDNLLMINAHIAHDCQIKNRCILANNATLAGHVELDDFVIVGGGATGIEMAGALMELIDIFKKEFHTIDFSDAISDNNEGNPLGNYTYSFSTGETIDTMQVSGYVVAAENLEPVKGIDPVDLFYLFFQRPNFLYFKSDDRFIKGGQVACHIILNRLVSYKSLG